MQPIRNDLFPDKNQIHWPFAVALVVLLVGLIFCSCPGGCVAASAKDNVLQPTLLQIVVPVGSSTATQPTTQPIVLPLPPDSDMLGLLVLISVAFISILGIVLKVKTWRKKRR